MSRCGLVSSQATAVPTLLIFNGGVGVLNRSRSGLTAFSCPHWNEAPAIKESSHRSLRSLVVSQCAILAAESVAAGQCVGVPLGRAHGDLLELFCAVAERRSDQGRDHPVAAVLALAAAATLAGMRGYRAIAGWVADVPAEVRCELYLRAGISACEPSGVCLSRVRLAAHARFLGAGTQQCVPATRQPRCVHPGQGCQGGSLAPQPHRYRGSYCATRRSVTSPA